MRERNDGRPQAHTHTHAHTSKRCARRFTLIMSPEKHRYSLRKINYDHNAESIILVVDAAAWLLRIGALSVGSCRRVGKRLVARSIISPVSSERTAFFPSCVRCVSNFRVHLFPATLLCIFCQSSPTSRSAECRGTCVYLRCSAGHTHTHIHTPVCKSTIFPSCLSRRRWAHIVIGVYINCAYAPVDVPWLRSLDGRGVDAAYRSKFDAHEAAAAAARA